MLLNEIEVPSWVLTEYVNVKKFLVFAGLEKYEPDEYNRAVEALTVLLDAVLTALERKHENEVRQTAQCKN